MHVLRAFPDRLTKEGKLTQNLRGNTILWLVAQTESNGEKIKSDEFQTSLLLVLQIVGLMLQAPQL